MARPSDLGDVAMSGDRDSTLAYYLVGFFDILGQSTALRRLQRLPTNKAEEADTVQLLKQTVGTSMSGSNSCTQREWPTTR